MFRVTNDLVFSNVDWLGEICLKKSNEYIIVSNDINYCVENDSDWRPNYKRLKNYITIRIFYHKIFILL